jgi:hypothetical protein
MARPLSRKARAACFIFGGGPVIVLWLVDPKLAAGAAGLVNALWLIYYGLSRLKQRAAFEPRERVAHRADNTQPAEQIDMTATTARCWVCQHVQTVPIGQEAFVCEQCNARLKRATAPANGA